MFGMNRYKVLKCFLKGKAQLQARFPVRRQVFWRCGCRIKINSMSLAFAVIRWHNPRSFSNVWERMGIRFGCNFYLGRAPGEGTCTWPTIFRCVVNNKQWWFFVYLLCNLKHRFHTTFPCVFFSHTYKTCVDPHIRTYTRELGLREVKLHSKEDKQ